MSPLTLTSVPGCHTDLDQQLQDVATDLDEQFQDVVVVLEEGPLEGESESGLDQRRRPADQLLQTDTQTGRQTLAGLAD